MILCNDSAAEESKVGVPLATFHAYSLSPRSSPLCGVEWKIGLRWAIDIPVDFRHLL